MNRFDLAAAALAVALWTLTMPPSVTLEDSGILTLAATFRGIPQPPGYPLWVSLAWPFSQIPFGEAAWRVALSSVLWGAVTVALIAGYVRQRTRPAIGLLTGVLLALSAGLWSQATLVEVYTLHTALLFGALRAGDLPAGHLRDALVGLLLGLGLSHHWPLWLCSAPGLFLLLRPTWRMLPGLLAGVLPWALLWFRRDAAVRFPHRWDSPTELVPFLLRRDYDGLFSGPEVAVSVADRLGFAWGTLSEALWQPSPLIVPLAALGIWSLGKLDRVAMAAMIALPSAGLMLFAWGTTGELWEAVFQPFPIAAWCTLTLAAGLSGRMGWLIGAAVWGLALIPSHNRRHDTYAADTADALLAILEPYATLMVHGDTDTGPLATRNKLDAVRPDLKIRHDDGQLLVDSLYGPRLPESEKRVIRAKFIERNSPVYSTADLQLDMGYALDGPLYRWRPGTTDNAVLAREAWVPYFQDVCFRPTRGAWQRAHQAEQRVRAGRWTAQMRDMPGLSELKTGLDTTFHGRLGALDVLMRGEPQLALDYARGTWATADGRETKREIARLWAAEGVALTLLRRSDEARGALAESLAIVAEPSTLAQYAATYAGDPRGLEAWLATRTEHERNLPEVQAVRRAVD